MKFLTVILKRVPTYRQIGNIIILCSRSDIRSVNLKRLVMLSCNSIIYSTYTQVSVIVILIKCNKDSKSKIIS